MGYSTALYAIDLDKLTSAVGSGDARLIRRLLPAKAGKAKAGKKDKKAGPRVLLNNKSEINLDRELVSFDDLIAELKRPKWKGYYLWFYETDGPRTGRWKKEDSFLDAMFNALGDSNHLEYQCCFTLKEFNHNFTEEVEEISVEEAAAELVEGKIRPPKQAHQYGYGLERLCRVLGTLLAAIEGKGGMLKALKLNTPLSRERSPVPLPKRDDFPGIGYLTAAEVQREVDRLGAMDLSFPRDEEIELDRTELFRSLQKAARKGFGVVAFYY